MFNFSFLDMTPYSKVIYFDLIGQFNQSLWPAQIIIVIVNIYLAYLLIKPKPYSFKVILIYHALFWALTGYLFVFHQYAQINWAGEYLAYLFFLQGLMLLIVALCCQLSLSNYVQNYPGSFLLKVMLLFLIILPFSGIYEGRLAIQLDFFTLTPAFCLLSTLIYLFFIQEKLKYLLIVIPVLWAIISIGLAVKLQMYEVYWVCFLFLVWIIQFIIVIINAVASSRHKAQSKHTG